MSKRYEDMLHLPHPTSAVHPRMPLADRAAQFSPFSALTGYAAAIQETARLTDEKIELEEDAKERLNRKLWWLVEHLDSQPPVTVTCFQADERKQGGHYVRRQGRLIKYDSARRCLTLSPGGEILVEDVLDMESDALPPLEGADLP